MSDPYHSARVKSISTVGSIEYESMTTPSSSPNEVRYEPLPIPCDLSQVSLGEAAWRIGPAFTYTLYVHPCHTVWVRSLLHRLSADVVENPLSPHINLIVDPTLTRSPCEWYLEANNRRCGSPGV